MESQDQVKARADAPAAPPPHPAASLVRAAQARLERIRQLGLEPYIAQLATIGYTVIPPELAAPKAQVDAIREALLRVAEARTGVKHALDTHGDVGAYVTAGGKSNSQYLLYYLLFEGREFEDWLENPVLQTMVDYAMRGAGQLLSMTSFVKWRGGGYGPTLGLHADAIIGASPEMLTSSTHEVICNSALILTPYSLEDGAIAMVPGSHTMYRNPWPGEGSQLAVPVEAPAGSLIFWHGATWHGAYPKRTDGLRLNLTTAFCHRALKTQEAYQRNVPVEMLDRHSEWFARAVGADDPMGWREQGAEPTYLPNRYHPRGLRAEPAS